MLSSNKVLNSKKSKSFELPTGKTYIILSLIISIIFNGILFVLNFFCPDFVYHRLPTFFDFMVEHFLVQSDPWKETQFILFWISKTIMMLLTIFTSWWFFRVLFIITTDKKWRWHYMNEHAKIINSCNAKEFNDRVAMCVGVCNDFLPNTIIQTANQTYKNLDVWICDDSSNPNCIKLIDEYAKQYGWHISRRDAEHKKVHRSKIANIKYWAEKYGKDYDFYFENDSSSIVTNTFVENALCYYHSQLIKDVKIGGIICNGNFYELKNFFSHINSKLWNIVANEFNDGGYVKTLSGPVGLNGWCIFMKVDTLLSIPLEKVECSVCDAARGIWLTKNGYTNIYEPFDFGGKMSVQNIQAWKNQRIKWTSGDYFMMSTGLWAKKFPKFMQSFIIKMMSFQASILSPIAIIAMLFDTIILMSLNIFYFNITVVILSIAITAAFTTVFVIWTLVNKMNPFIIIWYLFWISMFELSIFYKRAWQLMVRGYIMHTTSTLTCITRKDIHQSTNKEKLRMGLFDSIIILISLIICFALTFTIGASTDLHNHVESVFDSTGYINNWAIWFILFPFLTGPSIAYIILIWVGEIKTKKGYDPSLKYFPIEEYDFRYKLTKESEVWKKEHKNSK